MITTIEQRCVQCGEPFRANRRRAWCSNSCYETGRAKIRARMAGLNGSVAAGQAAEARYDERCEAQTRQYVKQWYTDKHNERLAKGCTPLVPLEMVLAGVDSGDITAVPGRVTRCLAVVEDLPGIFVKSEEGTEDAEGSD